MKLKNLISLSLVVALSTSLSGFTTVPENLEDKQVLLNEFEKSREMEQTFSLLEETEELVSKNELEMYLIDTFNEFINSNIVYTVDEETFNSIVNSFTEREADRIYKRDFEDELQKEYIKENFIDYAKSEIEYQVTLDYYTNKNRGQVSKPSISQKFPQYIDSNGIESISNTKAQTINNSDWEYFLENNRVVLTKYIGTNPNVVIDSKYKVNGNVYYTDLYQTFYERVSSDEDNAKTISIKVIDGDILKLTTGEKLFYRWLYNDDTIKSIDLTVLDTSQVQNMSNMFTGCDSLITLEISNFNTSQVDNMHRMFGECQSLTTLDISNFNTSQVTDMSWMFNNCFSLTALNLGDHFDTSKVTNMDSMFYSCKSLITLDLGEHFDTSKVTNMDSMFIACESLITLDLGDHFDTSKVTNMDSMFFNCKSLISLNLGDNFNTSQLSDISSMFYNCRLELIVPSSNTNVKLIPDTFPGGLIITTNNVVIKSTPTKSTFTPNIGTSIQLKPIYQASTIEDAKDLLLEDINTELQTKGYDFVIAKYFAIKRYRSNKIHITNDAQDNFNDLGGLGVDILLAFELKDDILKPAADRIYTGEVVDVELTELLYSTDLVVFLDSIINLPTDAGTHSITVQPVKSGTVVYNGENFLMAKDARDLTTTIEITKATLTPNIEVTNTEPIVYGDTVTLNVSLNNPDIKVKRDNLSVSLVSDSQVLNTFTTQPNTSNTIVIKPKLTGEVTLKLTTPGNQNIEGVNLK